MSLRDEEKLCIDKLIGLRDSEAFKTIEKLLRIRLDMHRDSLVMTMDGVVQGRAQECRHLLKTLKMKED